MRSSESGSVLTLGQSCANWARSAFEPNGAALPRTRCIASTFFQSVYACNVETEMDNSEEKNPCISIIQAAEQGQRERSEGRNGHWSKLEKHTILFLCD